MSESKEWLHVLEDGTKAVREGSAEILFNREVFYNPIQEFNRDLSIAAIKTFIQIASTEKAEKRKLEPAYIVASTPSIVTDSILSANQEKKQAQKFEQIHLLQQKYAKKQLDLTSPVLENIQFTILEALSASGLRSIRYAKEIQKIKQIIANDLLKEAADQIQINAIHNNVQNIVKPNHANATHLLYQTIASGQKFDVIDLDPYGSAAPFLDGAIQAVGDGGILCVTCTDMAVLAGGQPEACWAKYGGINIPNAPFTHEMALRILLHSIQTIAAKYKRAIEPMLSLSIDYYVRVFVRVRCNATLAKEASSKSSMLYYCQCCKSYETQKLGKFVKTEKGSKFGPSSLTVKSQCEVCNNTYHIAGPFYSAPIHEKQFVETMLGEVSTNISKYGTYERMLGMLVMVLEELPMPFYYVLPRMCGILHCQTPSLSTFISGLLSTGYQVSQSHCYQQSIKTDAPPNVVWDVLRKWCETNAPSKDKLSETSPGYRILEKEGKAVVLFEERPEATPFSAKFKFVRYQANPTENWGPQARPGKSSAGKEQLNQEPKESEEKSLHLEVNPLKKGKKRKIE